MFEALFSKKKNSVTIFFERLNKEQKRAVISIMFHIAQCDSLKQYHTNEKIYLRFYTNSLGIKESQISEKDLNAVYDHYKTISNFLPIEKVAVLSILWGLANIDGESNPTEYNAIMDAQLHFKIDLDDYTRNVLIEDRQKVGDMMNDILHPEENILEGALEVNKLIQCSKNGDINFMKSLYKILLTHFALQRVQSKAELLNNIKYFDNLHITESNLDVLYSYFRNCILKSLNTQK